MNEETRRHYSGQYKAGKGELREQTVRNSYCVSKRESGVSM
jgi:hypothetical protein